MADAPHEGYHYDAEGYPYQRRGVNLRMIILIAVFAVMSLYLFLFIGRKLEPVLYPGGAPGLFGTAFDIDPTQGDDPEAAERIDQRINILFMGLDKRYDEADDQPYRTDSVVIFTIDPFSKTAGAFSIPRDTWVDMPTANGDGVYTSTRINTVYEFGEYTYREDFPDGGAQAMIDTLDYNFGIPIDHYIVMDWSAFVDIIDELGGITVDVPEYAYDPAMSTCHSCGEFYPVEFVRGPEEMNGARALDFVRIRKSDNDFKRVERQQMVMRAVADKATSLNLFDVGKARDLYGAYKDAVTTDISDFRAAGLALLAKDVGLSDVNLVSAAPALYSCEATGCPGGASVLYIRKDIWAELQASVFSDVRLGQEGARIDILNGTPTPGLAAALGDLTAASGISRTRIQEDEYANGLIYPTTVIVDLTGKSPKTVDKLRELLDLPESRVLTRNDPDAEQFLGTTADLVVVLGEDTTLSAGVTITPPDDIYIPPDDDPFVPPEETDAPEEEITPTPVETEGPTVTPTVEPEPTATPEPTSESTPVPDG